MLGVLFYFATFLFCRLVSAVTIGESGGTFYNPAQAVKNQDNTKNKVFKFGDKVQIRWETDFDSCDLLLFQSGSTYNEKLQTNRQKQNTPSYEWIVSTNANLTIGPMFWFQIHNHSNYNQGFASRRFNLTSAGATTTASPPSTATGGIVPTSSPSSTTTDSAGSANDDSSGTGLSGQTKVGIGVGVGLGCAFLLALAGILWFFLRRFAATKAEQRPETGGPAPVYTPTIVDPQQVPYKPEYFAQQVQQPVAEIPGDRGVELPAEGAVRHELPG